MATTQHHLQNGPCTNAHIWYLLNLQLPLNPRVKNVQPLDGKDQSQAHIDTLMGEARVSPSFLTGSESRCLQACGVCKASPCTDLRHWNFCICRLILFLHCWQPPYSCKQTPSLILFGGSHPNFAIHLLHFLYEPDSRRCKEQRWLQFWHQQWVLQPPPHVAALQLTLRRCV